MGKNFLVGQSGGPSAVINASLYGVVTESYRSGNGGQVYGMVHGIEGFIKGNYMDFKEYYNDPEFHLLKNTPAAFLGSCRYRLPAELSDPVYNTIFNQLKDLDIGYVFYIGGNDSMDTVDKLSRAAKERNEDIKCIGIPKTIDNDLAHTDHTPGYGSAAKYVASTVREVVLDAAAYPQRTVTIIEIMGRNAGWLTAASVLARKHEKDNPYLIYMPEVTFDPDQFLRDVEEAFKHSNSVVAAISEGICLSNGRLLCEDDSTMSDAFGHKSLSGSAKVLEKMVKDKFKIKVRSVELSVTQRSAAKDASLTDVNEALAAGEHGVKAALNGENAKMVTFQRTADNPYGLEYVLKDVTLIANQEKKFPREWISPCGKDISNAFLTYALPLIKGEPDITYMDGLPKFFYMK